MMVISLVNSSDYEKVCGFLVCENESVSSSILQKKIDEIKSKMDFDGVDWIIDDVINEMPCEWMIKYYENRDIVRI